MAKYKTTKAFSKKGGIIPTGGNITSSHPRFAEGLRKGWIVKVGRDAKSKTSLPSSLKETELLPLESAPKLLEKVSDIETTLPVADSFESGDPDFEISDSGDSDSRESKVEAGEFVDEIAINKFRSGIIDEIEFLSRHDEAALLEKGIMQVSDFKEWNVERLMAIRGIGKSKAKKLMDIYNEWENSRFTE